MAFQACFFDWLNGFLPEDVRTDDLLVMAIDGKTLRHSLGTAKARRPLHIVSAWVAEFHISLGQVATEEKSNEITAIRELLDQIDIRGATVTIDAMGCQKDIAAKIVDRGGNYVIGVKGNQPTLHDTIESFFDDHWKDGDWFKGRCHRYQTIEQRGGCQVERYYDVAEVPQRKVVFENWSSVQAIGMVISVHRRGEKVTEEVRYSILSEYLKGEQFAKAVRQHWAIENNCHWQLDVLFNEDDSRVRERTLANNSSWLRRVAVSLLKHHPSKDSIKGKQQRASWNMESSLPRSSTVFLLTKIRAPSVHEGDQSKPAPIPVCCYLPLDGTVSRWRLKYIDKQESTDSVKANAHRCRTESAAWLS